MAKRYGGEFSPDGAGKGTAPKGSVKVTVDAAGTKANLLFLPPVILAFTSLNEGPTGLMLGLIGAGILALAAWLLHEGLRAEAAYHARKIARRPALPRKMLASALTGIGVFLAGMTGDAGLIGSIAFGIAATGLHVAAFGIDPLSDKRMEGIDTFQQDRVARVVDEAEAHLSAMADHVASLKDRKLDLRVVQFQDAAREMIRTVEEDPRDLTGARKYLGVYLMGARDAAAKFADLYRRGADPAARGDFEQLLTDLETSFDAKTRKMLTDDRSDMEIEIKVLRDRLQREGVRPE